MEENNIIENERERERRTFDRIGDSIDAVADQTKLKGVRERWREKGSEKVEKRKRNRI